MRISLHVLLVGLIAVLEVIACPTCMGRITLDSKPFFSNEFYKVGAGSMDHLYQALNEPSENKENDQTTAKIATNSSADTEQTSDNHPGENQ